MIHTLANIAGPAFALAEAPNYEIEPGDLDALLTSDFVRTFDREGVTQIEITKEGRLELRKPRGKPPRKEQPEPTIDPPTEAGFSLPDPQPDPLGEELERARRVNRELFSNVDDDLNPQAPSDWDMDGQGVVEAMPAVSNVPPEIAALLDDGETLTRDVRRKLTERLNVELAELKNLRGLAGEDLKREAEIEKLLGLFARLGEI